MYNIEMAKFAVVKTGGKQYLVKDNDEITVDRIDAKPVSAEATTGKENDKIELEKLAEFDSEKLEIQLGTPVLKQRVSATIVKHLKGDKIRVARFKAKVRYRKVKGFRPALTKIKIQKI